MEFFVQLHETGRAVVYPLLGLGGYATFIEVSSGRELRQYLQLNALWNDEDHTIHVLEEHRPLTEVPVEPGKERFLALVRPAKPIPPDADYKGTEEYMQYLHDEYGAQVYRLVEDQVGYVIVVSVARHDELRRILDAIPFNKKRQVRIQVAPIFTLQGEKVALKEAGILSEEHFESPEIPVFDVEEHEVRQWLSERKELVVVDVREPEEWAVGCIPVARLIRLSQLEEHVKELDPKDTLIMVCRTGNRSSQAAAWLRAHGYQYAYSLRGGMVAWRGETTEPNRI
ncbi:MAG: rhodanese-like domain-containing protein [Candidatus Binatia bacterium]